ncbi:hypothetical protein ASPWEDRAFT_171393 [Aspergillus wentii DTO 134E9]|uniref:WAP domain-containing protein n=1 Tax=Aspergillus wentii DTO 134E9 TaxID=1073089 RepID=A0A1L9RSL1_ASPWE|nr:uncharacterized protein ASPWEDRAFT_171393 [Aspergillus wentii DTO 134E9]KAI9930768.1 hypothetical protein MW887_011525 [Aspergillus wentii]OJJ37941.1 hypothetical protein ASPWEDRAFT_171393 [Aspergillus wentii DTO 134E9]
MHIQHLTLATLVSLAGSSLAACGDADACVLTETCTTVTRTAPATTITTCVPTPTCLKVYQDCVSGGGGEICCSGYCAATKCRPTDPEWPGCAEDLEICSADGDCCYGNKCIGGVCRRE